METSQPQRAATRTNPAAGEAQREGGGESLAGVRIAVLDLARGIAVLGILVINMPVFAGPMIAGASPAWAGSASFADIASFSAAFVIFEGKMRAMFGMLFGASLLLFLDRAEDAGRDGVRAQLRRLAWLALFGYAHFLFFWWGDILFTYAIAGMIALTLRRLDAPHLFAASLALTVLAATFGALRAFPTLAAIEMVHDGAAGPVLRDWAWKAERAMRAGAQAQIAEYSSGMLEQVALRLREKPLFPLRQALDTVVEALSYMLIGMAMLRSGLFTGGWSARGVRRLAVGGIGLGLMLTLPLLWWMLTRGFPLAASVLAPYYLGVVGRLAQAAGYLAAIVLFARVLLTSRIGQHLAAAGRMAFSNYLGATIMMTAIFHGWGLGLIGRHYGHATLMLFVAGGWGVMLAWSQPWLARFGIGPLEALWRWLAGSRRRSPERGEINSQ